MDVKESLDIGLISVCRSILKKMNGLILTEDESEQERKLFGDKEIWKDPKIKSAADFDWLSPGLITKTAAASIVISQIGNEFIINKNILFGRTRGYQGKKENLYDTIIYWYEKKRKWRQRKKWRDIEGVGHIYI